MVLSYLVATRRKCLILLMKHSTRCRSLSEISIIRNCARPASVGRDHGRHVALYEVRAKAIRVESLVAKDVPSRQTGDQRLGRGRLVRLAGGVEQTQHIAESIDGDVDFRAQAATRSPDRLFLTPPFPPAACWCTRMIVPSMITDYKSGSARASRIRSQTPAFAHRRNRLCTLFQFPKHGERSRHGAPVRAIHTMASTKSRLSSPVRPGSPGLPGISSAIRFHCSFVRRWRIIRGSPHSESLESQHRFRGNPLNVHAT